MPQKNASQKAEELKGRTKEAVGSAANDRELRREGRADQRTSRAKALVDEVVERGRNVVNAILGRR